MKLIRATTIFLLCKGQINESEFPISHFFYYQRYSFLMVYYRIKGQEVVASP